MRVVGVTTISSTSPSSSSSSSSSISDSNSLMINLQGQVLRLPLHRGHLQNFVNFLFFFNFRYFFSFFFYFFFRFVFVFTSFRSSTLSRLPSSFNSNLLLFLFQFLGLTQYGLIVLRFFVISLHQFQKNLHSLLLLQLPLYHLLLRSIST